MDPVRASEGPPGSRSGGSSEEAAQRYAARHPVQTAGRSLVRVRTVGRYHCSVHDSVWIDVLRRLHPWPGQADIMARAYWAGQPADRALRLRLGLDGGEDAPLEETLLLGRVQVLDAHLPGRAAAS